MLTVFFTWKRTGESRYHRHETKPLGNPEAYIERLLQQAVAQDIKISKLEVHESLGIDRWGQPQYRVPWYWWN